MIFLRKILLAIGMMIVLAFFKFLLSKLLPSSQIFHYNLLSCIQLLLLLWAIVTGLLETTIWKKTPSAKAHFISFITFILIMALAETGCCWMIDHPGHIPARYVPAFRYYYNNYQRNILQYDRHIACYDTTLFYKMIANNRSLFSNVEFSDSIFTDANGFRDNDNTVSHPQVLCLGDSYTLGWGVHQDQSYPYLLSKLLQVPVLNTGMSSYGTAREIASVRPLDKSAISAVIIQYCPNDADENEACARNGYRLVVSPPHVYDSAAKELKWSKRWFPGKYACTLMKIFLAEKIAALRNSPPSSASDDNSGQYEIQADQFLNILKTSGLDFNKVRVFVFEIDAYADLNAKFIRALEAKLADPGYHTLFKDHIRPLHIETLFTPADYYLLDEHLRPVGQQKLATFLANAIIRDTAYGSLNLRRNIADNSGASNAATRSAPALVK